MGSKVVSRKGLSAFLLLSLLGLIQRWHSCMVPASSTNPNCLISGADYYNNCALDDTSNRIGTYTPYVSLFNKRTLANSKSKMAAIFSRWPLFNDKYECYIRPNGRTGPKICSYLLFGPFTRQIILTTSKFKMATIFLKMATVECKISMLHKTKEMYWHQNLHVPSFWGT